MRVLLITTGSRGDVEPFVALACGLRGAGHVPTIAAPSRFRGLAVAHDIAFIGLDDSLFELQDELAGQGALAAITGAFAARAAHERFLAGVVDLADEETDVVVYHPKTLAAPMVAERQGVPSLAVQLIPLYQPTGAFPAPILAARVPRPLNRASWRLVSAVEAPWRRMLRDIHRDRLKPRTPLIGLAERIAAGGALNAWSPHLLPAPLGWPADAEPLGFWRLSAEDWRPSAVLVDFLAAGDAPVSVGFGSMISRHPEALGAMVRDGLRKAGRRGVVTTGAGALALDSTDDILVLEQVPHDWLFPRVAMAVHHGGIGTLAAALTAGVPQIIKPFLGDQSFWARRADSLGIATPLRVVTPEVFADALTAASGLGPRARSLAEAVAQDDGIGAAVARIERCAEDGAPR